jgi:hypothetical protein
MVDLDRYPMAAAVRHPTTDEPILLKPGVKGYFPAPEGLDPDEYNRDMGVTPAQLRAMEIGAIFGWDVPGANPAYHEKEAADPDTDD